MIERMDPSEDVCCERCGQWYSKKLFATCPICEESRGALRLPKYDSGIVFDDCSDSFDDVTIESSKLGSWRNDLDEAMRSISFCME